MTQPPNEPSGPDPQSPYERPRPRPGQSQYPPVRPPVPQRQRAVRVDLGARARQRPHPRAGAALAGAGAGLLVLGTLAWSLGYLVEGIFDGIADDGPPDTGRRFLGFSIFLAFTVVGYAMLVVRRRGPLATAATVLATASVPLTLLFVSFDFGSGDPVSIDAVFLVSIAVWLTSYLFVPGARGRVVLLTLVAVFIPAYVGVKIAGDAATRVSITALAPDIGGEDFSGTGSNAILAAGAVSVAFGIGYYLLARVFDRRAEQGVATAFVVAGFVGTAGGIATLTREVEGTGVGILLVVFGLLISTYAGRAGRRFTTWTWAAAVAVGVVAIVVDTVDGVVAVGVTAMVIGVVLTVGAVTVAQLGGERPDVDEVPDSAGVPAR